MVCRLTTSSTPSSTTSSISNPDAPNQSAGLPSTTGASPSLGPSTVTSRRDSYLRGGCSPGRHPSFDEKGLQTRTHRSSTPTRPGGRSYAFTQQVRHDGARPPRLRMWVGGSRLRAVLEVLNDGASVSDVAWRYGSNDRPYTGGCASTRRADSPPWPTGAINTCVIQSFVGDGGASRPSMESPVDGCIGGSNGGCRVPLRILQSSFYQRLV